MKTQTNTPAVGPPRRAAWLRLLAGLGLLWILVFWLAPWAQQLGPVATLHEFVEERDIDATALFYTDSAEFEGVQLTLHNSMRYAAASARRADAAP